VHGPIVENAVISSRRPGSALKPNELCAEQICRRSSVSTYSDALVCFWTEKYWGIKAVHVRSERYSDSTRSRCRFGFGSGHRA
jgi:hypothetical protein